MPVDIAIIRSFRITLLALLGGPFLLLALAAALMTWRVSTLVDSMRWVDHTDDVISHAWQLEKQAIDMETGVRGYLLTSDPVYLEPFHQAFSTLTRTDDALHELVRDNSKQQAALAQVDVQLGRWRSFAGQAVVSPDAGTPEGLEVGRRGKTLMDAFRREMKTFIEEEQRLHGTRSALVMDRVRGTLGWALAVVLLAASGCALIAYRQFRGISKRFVGVQCSPRIKTLTAGGNRLG